jgi:hypothetical protein
MAAVSTGASVYNTNRTARKQDQTLANQIRKQGEKQREADSKVNQLLDQREGSNADGERKGILAKFQEAIQNTGGNANAGLQQAGALSQAAKDGTADATLGIADYGSQVADLLSKIDAPAAQRQREENTNTRFGQEIGQIMRRSQGDDFLSQLQLQGITRNPWIDAGASALSGASGAMAGGGGRAGASAGGGGQWGAFGPSGGYWSPNYRPGG